VKAGKAPRIKQDEAKATYEGRATADIARIDWGKSWRQIDPLVRGCNPVPGAWTTLDGKTLQIFEVTPIPAKDPKGISGKYGEVVAVEADGFTVVLPRRPHQGAARKTGRRPEGRRRRMGGGSQARRRRAARLSHDKCTSPWGAPRQRRVSKGGQQQD
jgi:methionyl-tRNA formyltransferase